MKRALLTILCLASLAGCATTSDLALPRAPTWVQPADARILTSAEVLTEIRRVAPKTRVTGLSDRGYTRVSHAWLVAYTAWTWTAARAVGITYTPQSFDCENFAAAFNEIVAIKASQAGVQAAPLCASITVQDTSDTLHALVGVSTDRGIYIVEPQPDAGPFRITALADYTKPILAVELGLASPY